MAELKSITYEESRAEHFKALMKKMERKIDYWQYRGRYSLERPSILSRSHHECSEAGMQYNFYNDALVAFENQPKWISVEERLPETGLFVICCAKGYLPRIGTGWYDSNLKIWHLDFASYHPVTHWMPLPKPPKEEERA